MDRTITYTQAVPRSQDFLQNQKDALIGLGYLAQAILGQPQQIFPSVVAWVDGLLCSPASPPSLNVTVGAGSIYEMEEMDATSYGVLGVDTSSVLKQGLLTSPVTLTVTPPTTSGYSQYYLVEAIYNDVDGGPTVLPYYNAANPLIPLGGPGNSGQQQYTIRQGVCVVALKAGVAAPTGSQTIPTADAGYSPLWSILVSNGQTTIISNNIAPIANAPFISPKLTQIPPAIQAQVNNFAVDLSLAAAPNAMSIVLPSFTNVVEGLTLRVIKSPYKNTANPTLSINGGAPVPIYWADTSSLIAGDWPAGAVGQITFNGTSWELYTIAGPTIFARVAPGSVPTVSDASLLHYGIDTGTANAANCVSVSPTIGSSVTVGITVEVQKTNAANTGSMSLTIPSTIGGPVTAPLYWADGNSLQAGDWPANALGICVFDGTYYRLLSVTNRPVTYPQGAYVHYGVASGTNTLTTTTTPTFNTMADGTFLELTPTAANTGPVTLAPNGLNPAAVQTVGGSNLAAGQLQNGVPVILMALGGVWRLLFGGGGLTNMQVLTASGTYIPSPGAQKAIVFATGGGGAGGSGGGLSAVGGYGCGGGGESGATAVSIVQVAGSLGIAYTIGAGGAPSPSSSTPNTQAGSGGQTSFGSYAIAPGGQGGYNTCTVQGPFAGGTTGGTGMFVMNNTPGEPTGNGYDGYGSSAGQINSLGGMGGPSFWGGCGIPGICQYFGGTGSTSYIFQSGTPGTGWGSGGGGATGPIPAYPTPCTGGAGKQGVIVVFEF